MQPILTMTLRELRLAFRRPLFWIFLILNSLFSVFYFYGGVSITASSGGRAADEVVHLNGPYALTLFYMAVPFVIVTLFAAIAMAGTVVRDEELKIEEMLRSTHLSARGYLLGKLLGTAGWVFGIVLLCVALALGFDSLTAQLAAADGIGSPEAYGSANPLFHLHPFLLHAVPWLLFAMTGAFYLGVRTRAPLFVYGTLTVLFVLALAIGDLEPEWLQRWSQDTLGLDWTTLRGWIEPSGISWLIETYGREDRGVQFYNTELPALTTGIAVNRIVLLLLSALAVWRSMAVYTRQRHGRLEAAGSTHSGRPGGEENLALPAPESMRRMLELRRRGKAAGPLRIAWTELRLLLRQPSVWIFVPIIWLFGCLAALLAEGAFEASLIVTANQASARLAAALSIWTCGFGACLAIESLHRERVTRVGDVLFSTAVSSRSIVLGKILAVFLLMLGVIGGAALVTALFQVGLHKTASDPGAYLLNLGVLLLPGVLFFIALTALFTVFFRNRMAAYGALILFTVLFSIGRFTGWLDWRGIMVPTNLVAVSDITGLKPYAEELWLNRILFLGLTLFLIILTVQLYPRTDRARTERFTWRRLRTAKFLLGFAVLVLFTPVVAGFWLAHNINQGPSAKWREDAIDDYAARNRAKWGREDALLPQYQRIDFDVEFFPEERRFTLDGRFTFVNNNAEPLQVIPLTVSLDWEIEPEGHVFLDEPDAAGQPVEASVKDRNHLYEIRLPEELAPGGSRTLRLKYSGVVHPGPSRTSAAFDQWILEDAILVHTFDLSILPSIGFTDPVEGEQDTADDQADERELAEHYHDDHVSYGGMRSAMDVTCRMTVPSDLTAICVGSLVERQSQGDKTTWTYRTDHSVYFYALMAGRYEQITQGDCTVYYHPTHDQNVQEIATALDRSRRFYSAIFVRYPFEQLRIVEFPSLAGFAMGFPTLIPFSESIGFLTEGDDGISNVNFMVTAHEAAHQWWGTITWPAQVPGSPFLTEALAEYSTLMMEERFNGRVAARNRRIRFERAYLSGRHKDVERPIVRIDGSEPGDQVTWYNKGGWAFWMTSERIGRDAFVEALREYIAEFSFKDDHPTIHDLLRHIRAQAGGEHGDFLRETFYEVVLPRPEIVSVETKLVGEEYQTTVVVKNAGTGRAALDVEVSNRRLLTSEIGLQQIPTRLMRDDLEDPLGWLEEQDPEPPEQETPYEAVRGRLTLGPGDSGELLLRGTFVPAQVTLDPDAQLLMSGRNRARRAIQLSE